MRRRKYVTIAAAIGLATGATLFASGAVNATAPEPIHPNPPGVDLCALPVAERVGGWVCPASEDEQRELFNEKFGTPPTLGAGPRKTMVSADDGKYGYCLSTGCWYKESATYADISIRSYYGYGGESYGRADIWISDAINYDMTVSKPQTKTGYGAWSYSNRWWTERYWVTGSSTNEGGILSDRRYDYSAYVNACNGCGVQFAPVYLYDRTSGYEFVMHSIKWKDARNMGIWFYVNAKSTRMAWSDDHGYRFMGTADTPTLVAKPMASGWYYA